MSNTPVTAVKLAIVDADKNYLMMWRSDHPTFGADPDLPGGTLEDGEDPLQTMVREVEEEIGVTIDSVQAHRLYDGTDYSKHGTRYVLYGVTVDKRPDVIMSWEHSDYKWLPKEEFIAIAKSANDTYMHMVASELGTYAG